jgi:hypothetical protein
LYLPSNIEFPTTVTELIAIARPASIGSHRNIPTPRNGTSTAAAIGIKPVLYAKAKKGSALSLILFDDVLDVTRIESQTFNLKNKSLI